MISKEMLMALKLIKTKEVRKDSDDYYEMVVEKTELESLNAVLEKYLKAPIKPQGMQPSAEALKISERFGGIRRNQAMYFSQNEAGSVMALLWPWEDGWLCTAKVIAC